MQQSLFEKFNIKITTNHKPAPKILIQSTKFVHVLVNIFTNAIQARCEKDCEIKITSETLENEIVQIKIKDNGTGVEEKNIKKIFSHGFTTKEDGHGFGLHTSANYMTEMGGKLTLESEGKDMGATAIITFFPQKEIDNPSES